MVVGATSNVVMKPWKRMAGTPWHGSSAPGNETSRCVPRDLPALKQLALSSTRECPNLGIVPGARSTTMPMTKKNASSLHSVLHSLRTVPSSNSQGMQSYSWELGQSPTNAALDKTSLSAQTTFLIFSQNDLKDWIELYKSRFNVFETQLKVCLNTSWVFPIWKVFMLKLNMFLRSG